MSESNNENTKNEFENNKSTHENPFASKNDSQFSPFENIPLVETGDIFKNSGNNNIEKEENEETKKIEIIEKKEDKEKKEEIEIKEAKQENQENNKKENEQENNKEIQDDKNSIKNLLTNDGNDNDNNSNPFEDKNLPSYDNFQQSNNINNNINKNMENNNQVKKDQFNPIPNNNKRYDHDNKKIKEILEKCESLYKESRILYENYDIQKAIIKLTNAVKGLDGLKKSIVDNKTEFNSFLPQVVSIRTKYFNYLYKYRLTIYQLIPRKFSPVRFNQGENIQEFVKKYILTEPFVTYDDIYEPNLDKNKTVQNMMNENYQKSLRLKYKNLLLFGPKGSGKTLAVHALANQLKGKVAQIEGIELFKIPNFSLEFMKVAFNHMQNKPLIVYIRNIEKMMSNMNNFNFIYDKVCGSKLQDVILIVSSSIQLPKSVSEKFHYSICIRPCEKSQKANFMKFVAKKLGINLNMSDKDLSGFTYQNLDYFSNEDMFNLIVAAIDLKKNKFGGGEDALEKGWGDGINMEDLHNAMNNVKGSLTQDDIRNYYL